MSHIEIKLKMIGVILVLYMQSKKLKTFKIPPQWQSKENIKTNNFCLQTIAKLSLSVSKCALSRHKKQFGDLVYSVGISRRIFDDFIQTASILHGNSNFTPRIT